MDASLINPPSPWTGRSRSLAQTLALGEVVALHAQPGDLVGLIGELGAGKTQFVRGMAVGLGLGDAGVASPTFVMVQEYFAPPLSPAEMAAHASPWAPPPLPPDPAPGDPAEHAPGASLASVGEQGASVTPTNRPRPRMKLVHMDAYRLSSLEELESVGWEITTDRLGGEIRDGALMAVEWADKLDQLLGDDHLRVELQHLGEDARQITITPHGPWLARWPALCVSLDQAVGAQDL